MAATHWFEYAAITFVAAVAVIAFSTCAARAAAVHRMRLSGKHPKILRMLTIKPLLMKKQNQTICMNVLLYLLSKPLLYD